jgi:hypothetical protein
VPWGTAKAQHLETSQEIRDWLTLAGDVRRSWLASCVVPVRSRQAAELAGWAVPPSAAV